MHVLLSEISLYIECIYILIDISFDVYISNNMITNLIIYLILYWSFGVVCNNITPFEYIHDHMLR